MNIGILIDWVLIMRLGINKEENLNGKLLRLGLKL